MEDENFGAFRYKVGKNLDRLTGTGKRDIMKERDAKMNLIKIQPWLSRR